MSYLIFDSVETAQPFTMGSSAIILKCKKILKNDKLLQLKKYYCKKDWSDWNKNKFYWVITKIIKNLKIEVMGCFPDKPINKAQPISPNKEKLIKRFYEENPHNDSVYLPVNIKSSHLKNQENTRSRKSLLSSPKKAVVTSTKGRKSPTKRSALSQ